MSLVVCCVGCNSITGSSDLVVGDKQQPEQPEQSRQATDPATTPSNKGPDAGKTESKTTTPATIEASIECTAEDECKRGSVCCGFIGIRHAKCIEAVACAMPNLRLCDVDLDCHENEHCVERSTDFNGLPYCTPK